MRGREPLAPDQVSGTGSSNPLPSSEESANHWCLCLRCCRRGGAASRRGGVPERAAVGNYQPPKGDWRSVSVQELIAQERQRSLLWRPQRFWVGARSTFGEDRAQRGSMSRTPRRYDAQQVRRLSDTTIAYYDQFARAFWKGTRHHDVSQNYAAFLDAIERDPPYSILDLRAGRIVRRERARRFCGGTAGDRRALHSLASISGPGVGKVARSAETATQPPRRSLCLVNS